MPSRLRSLFQFHKGTIKAFLPLSCVCFSTYFNSIKVQLKQKQLLKFVSYYRFQFHKGTIKALE